MRAPWVTSAYSATWRPCRVTTRCPAGSIERAGITVAELPGRDRLALDLDTPLDLALLAQVRGVPAALGRLARAEELRVPRLAELRAILRDGRREAAGLRARVVPRDGPARTARGVSRPLPGRRARPAGVEPAGPGSGHYTCPAASCHARATARARGGPSALAATVAELADGAILDTRVLLADRLGADEASWPSPEDRYASDLLRADAVRDPWLRELTASAAAATGPILLGGHTLVPRASGSW